ncbi:uracil-DNA glycosylase [Thiocystis minor]|uniref:uracil-DNA glycosylase family protein n=1 Tax=Thiocystis minor TaxID=61597 RepID=UPI001912A25C|nr:uracil-DNA glycosylase family protein [Thiocystis minor]MBK5965200.1 uracil-DNA glycosylase [Thiocystis minor]
MTGSDLLDADPRARHVALIRLHADLEACRRCPGMQGPPVHSAAVLSPVMLIGQAPGTREIEQLRPFCWTAGKTLFGWFASIGLDETACRKRLLISAVCRCFPGKNPKGGDRVPDRGEVERCGGWWRTEMNLLRPRLIIPIGKLAIAQVMEFGLLNEVIGRQWSYRSERGWTADIIPLPHPSGASTWFKMEPGRTLLAQALGLIAAHPDWRGLVALDAESIPSRQASDRSD